MLSTGPVLVYDGACGFCAESVRLVLERDRRKLLRFAPREGSFGRALLERHPEVAGIDSVFWVELGPGGSERVLARSDAALRVAAYLGGVFRLATVGKLVPRALRDALYAFVAEHRHRLAPGGQRCLVPSADDRGRFLE